MIGHLDQPGLRLHRPREGPLLVAEQLRFQQVLGQRRAVDGNEGPRGALAVGVDGPRHQLLARPGLSQHEDIGLGARGLLDQLEHADHGGAAPDDVLEAERLLELLAEVAVLESQLALAQRAVDGDAELVGGEGLGQVVEGPLLHGADGRLDAGERGDDDHRQVRVDAMSPAQQLQALDARHLEIGQQYGGALRFDERERLPGHGGRHALMAGEAEQSRRALDHLRFVVDDEDAF